MKLKILVSDEHSSLLRSIDKDSDTRSHRKSANFLDVKHSSLLHDINNGSDIRSHPKSANFMECETL